MRSNTDTIFRALASNARRRMMDIVKEQPGCRVGEVASFFEMSRVAVMKHLGVLEEAGLITSKKEGRSRRLYFNPVPIQMIYDRWTTDYSSYWARGLTAIKYKIEIPESE